jgi:Holliday junction resolvase
MTHPSKRKGNGFERELVNQALESGMDAKRAYASNGESLGHHAEVDLVVAGKRIQAKRRKALPAYLIPSDEVDATVFRADHGDTLVLLNWFDYLDLIKK